MISSRIWIVPNSKLEFGEVSIKNLCPNKIKSRYCTTDVDLVVNRYRMDGFQSQFLITNCIVNNFFLAVYILDKNDIEIYVGQ